MILFVLLSAGVACNWIEIKLEPPPGTGTPKAEFSIQIITQTPEPTRFVTGVEPLNEAIAEGECPKPEAIPFWLDFKDPKNPGQLCPKTALAPQPFPPGVTSP